MKTSLIYLLGLGMGTVLGLLIAPEAGKITRKKIRDEADRIIDKAITKKNLDEPVDNLEPEIDVIMTEERYRV